MAELQQKKVTELQQAKVDEFQHVMLADLQQLQQFMELYYSMWWWLIYIR